MDLPGFAGMLASLTQQSKRGSTMKDQDPQHAVELLELAKDALDPNHTYEIVSYVSATLKQQQQAEQSPTLSDFLEKLSKPASRSHKKKETGWYKYCVIAEDEDGVPYAVLEGAARPNWRAAYLALHKQLRGIMSHTNPTKHAQYRPGTLQRRPSTPQQQSQPQTPSYQQISRAPSQSMTAVPTTPPIAAPGQRSPFLPLQPNPQPQSYPPLQQQQRPFMGNQMPPITNPNPYQVPRWVPLQPGMGPNLPPPGVNPNFVRPQPSMQMNVSPTPPQPGYMAQPHWQPVSHPYPGYQNSQSPSFPPPG